MEGLIPFVYKAIVEYKNGRHGGGHHVLNSWLCESPSVSYIRLPSGDSDRFESSDFQLFSGTSPASSAVQMISSGVQSPFRHRVASN
ncbi:unnamed protein product [Malus baccata var. baccata]|uniref:Uncharacterized protein n=1 Tax=Malus baccata TaxID=106549 RepID=A0A540NCL0_MALBA|nr:hypothetical protein C1H46_006207 [Malus baccata]